MRYNKLMIFVRKLVWDKENIDHIKKHDVTPDEVEQVCHGQVVVFDTYNDRYLIIGMTLSGKTLTIILDPEPEPNTYYPVTARSADKAERKKYNEMKGVKI